MYYERHLHEHSCGNINRTNETKITKLRRHCLQAPIIPKPSRKPSMWSDISVIIQSDVINLLASQDAYYIYDCYIN